MAFKDRPYQMFAFHLPKCGEVKKKRKRNGDCLHNKDISAKIIYAFFDSSNLRLENLLNDGNSIVLNVVLGRELQTILEFSLKTHLKFTNLSSHFSCIFANMFFFSRILFNLGVWKHL